MRDLEIRSKVHILVGPSLLAFTGPHMLRNALLIGGFVNIHLI